MLKCQTCQQTLTGRQTKFCSSRCKNLCSNNKHQNYVAQQQRGIERKKEFVKLLGGKCEICSYDKNLSALCFHHLDSSKKEQQLTIRELSNNSMNTLLKELKKCKLLCHNCHMEVHYSQHSNT